MAGLKISQLPPIITAQLTDLIPDSQGATTYKCELSQLVPLFNGSLSFLPLSGGTMTGAINMGGFQINNMANPTLAQDAATMAYVQSQLGTAVQFNRQIFTSSGTYTPTAGLTFAVVQCVGAGGGGGGAMGAPGANGVACGGGGGSYAESLLTAAAIGPSQTVTIGVGGAGGAAGNNNGTAGTSSSFGALLVCGGGNGGQGSTNSSGSYVLGSGGIGGVATAGQIQINGQTGNIAIMVDGSISPPIGLAGPGGNAAGGFGLGGFLGFAFYTSTGYGAGGPGAYTNLANQAGGNGLSGIIVVTEIIAG